MTAVVGALIVSSGESEIYEFHKFNVATIKELNLEGLCKGEATIVDHDEDELDFPELHDHTFYCKGTQYSGELSEWTNKPWYKCEGNYKKDFFRESCYGTYTMSYPRSNGTFECQGLMDINPHFKGLMRTCKGTATHAHKRCEGEYEESMRYIDEYKGHSQGMNSVCKGKITTCE